MQAENREEPAAARGTEGSRTEIDSLYEASQFRLIAARFRKHRFAVYASTVIAALYLAAAFCEFLAPYTPARRNIEAAYAPPQLLHVIDADGVHLRPFVYALRGYRDPETRRVTFAEDKAHRYPVRLFVRGEPYRFWGAIECRLHLFGVDEGAAIHLLGTDGLGRDMLTRIIYGARISLTVGLIGVMLSFAIGLVVGVVSGYYGGIVDHGIQRGIEILRSFPSIPLWMALSAALPASWPPLGIYVGITVVLSLVGWTGLARQVRGKILALREEDFVTAATLAGAGPWRIMLRHLLPSFTSHIVVSLTLAFPGMILGETALSFLGLGLRPPITSWGVLLKEAQNVQAIASYPWLLTPALAVIVTVLCFNFAGDGLRDAADPYSQ